MASPAINFRNIRPHNGSQHGGFEELACQLAALDTPAGLAFQRKGAGADAGLECYRVERDGSETGWQAKYFFELGSGEAAQITKSFDNAVAKHPRLSRFIVCLPFDLSDGRIDERKSERVRWNDWVAARLASIAPRVVDIELWGGFQLTERLSRSDPLHVGRRTYWFDLPHFGADWFRERFEITRKALGRRYTPELNIELPVRQAITAFARDHNFLRKITGWADTIDEARYRALRHIGEVLGSAHADDMAALGNHTAAISAAIRAAPGPTDQLPITAWQTLLETAVETLDRCRTIMWDIRRRSEVDSDAMRYGRSVADRLFGALYQVGEELSAPAIRLGNERRLMLTGQAGVGKSHLLADVAERHIASGLPAVLTLGSAFSDAEPWRQIAEQLGLTNTPPDAILGALDAAAEAVGTRALVMVDAINERNGATVWSDRLAAFLAVADRFRHVVLLVSCRSTYVPYIVRDLDETTLPRIEHPGFAGRAAEAARRYLDQRGIVRMAVPHLAPEFENPLFLRTCCDMLERRGENEIPRGIAGVSSIFDFYFSAVVESLNLRMGLAPRLRRVETALASLADAMVVAGMGYLSLDEVNTLLERVHPSGGRIDQDLLSQLEYDGVLAVEPVSDGDNIVEMVRFTFERSSDHRIAQRLLDTHVGDGDPTQAFAEGRPLAAYVASQNLRHFAGVVEAFAIQLPERYGVELLDAIDDDSRRLDVVDAFHRSLRWRRQDAFSARTLELVGDWANAIGDDAVLDTLLAIATEPDNRFNADYLDRWLRSLQMPERDVHWSVPATRAAKDSDGPIHTLIEWVLGNGLEQIDVPRARLAAFTLAWLTSLSHRWVRDMATKALATLLVDRRGLAVELIRQFADVDDAYVVDRVFAAAYGAATRCSSDEGLAELAHAAFAGVFARDPLPAHALVRDHARGIIELAESRGVLPANVPLDRARPPYPNGAPLETITEAALGSYLETYGENQFHDEICRSAVDEGDFARYEIDPLADHFLLLSRTEHGRSMREIYEEWRRETIAPHPDRVAALERVIELNRRARPIDDENDDPWIGHVNIEDFLRSQEVARAERDEATQGLESLLSAEEVQEFRIRASGYIQGRMWDEESSAWHQTYAGNRSRRWIAWRAHELGWTPERFADFDRQVHSRSRNEHRVERIGKKYQWIAYYELAGRLSDIALVNGHYQDDPELYSGPWQVGMREMDPTILVTRAEQWGSDQQGATWWAPHAPRWRNDPPTARLAWMEDRSLDVPDPVQQIDVTDASGRRWLVLDTDVGRNQLVMVDGERTMQRMTWHKVRSMLVARDDLGRLERLLKRSPINRDMPPGLDIPHHVYLGEYPWHPAFAEINEALEIGDRNPILIRATVIDWRVERAGYDYSIEESFDFTVPSPSLVRDLGLRLADGRSLAYATADGTILCKDPSIDEPGFSAAVIDRDALRAYLDATDQEIIWVFTGEKSAHGGRPNTYGWGGRLKYWGIYRFDGGSIRGTLTFEHQPAQPEQLEEFLAHP